MSLVLPFCGELPLQSTTQSDKIFKLPLGCCKTNIISKSQQKSLECFLLKDYLPYVLVSCTV